LGYRHPRTILDGCKASEVPHRQHQILHEVDRGQACNNYFSLENNKLPLAANGLLSLVPKAANL